MRQIGEMGDLAVLDDNIKLLHTAFLSAKNDVEYRSKLYHDEPSDNNLKRLFEAQDRMQNAIMSLVSFESGGECE